MKKFINKYRWSGSWFDLHYDGIYPKERLKGKDKKFARKRTLKKIKETQDRIERENYKEKLK